MSAEVIIIIVGVVLVLLAIGDSIKIKKSSLGLINPKVRIPLGILGVLLIIFGGYTFGTINPQGQIEQPVLGNKQQIKYPIEKVQVLSPVDGDSVDCRILTCLLYTSDAADDVSTV